MILIIATFQKSLFALSQTVARLSTLGFSIGEFLSSSFFVDEVHAIALTGEWDSLSALGVYQEGIAKNVVDNKVRRVSPLLSALPLMTRST